MQHKKSILTCLMLVSTLFGSAGAMAAEYDIDASHSFVQFRTKHLGYSWLVGRFDRLSGVFDYAPEQGAAAQSIFVEVDVTSVNSNHAERDKHLRSDDFLNSDDYPNATFKSTSYEGDADGGTMHGELTLHGVTKPLAIEIKKIGEGNDPWGGYRAGFEGKVQITRADFGMEYNLGPDAVVVELDLYIEGVRRQ
ncbi:YceI family protein [Candidatus Persebacteraceae bacterium Df01]|jgi:polyisoprenoid-binding protein YceI|uniref:YceI family protein n=1 Tax=Candidatus Doriopsillibacter californiensis TaxID=2970740 RepID=A0ABT7QLZ7_9GAMM|nr:YceI family protein [Candidatus Persebacteraceae bacterium Df01]